METLKPIAFAVAALLFVAGGILAMLGGGDGVWKSEGVIQVEAPTERAFRWLTDAGRRREWVDGLVDTRIEQGGRLEKGSRVHETVIVDGVTHDRVLEVTAYDGVSSFAYHTTEDGVQIEVSYEVGAFQTGERSRIDFAYTVTFPGALAKITEPLLARSMKARVHAELERLRRLAESQE